MNATATGASAPTRKTKPLAFRPRQKSPMRRLPFVGREHTADQSFSMWNVPASGGYFGGGRCRGPHQINVGRLSSASEISRINSSATASGMLSLRASTDTACSSE
jgi:hypothetical protein